MNTLHDRTMALAATLQAVAQVQYIARHGETDDEQLAAALNTIMVTDPDSIDDIYPDKKVLANGYRWVINQLGDNHQKDVEITRYLVGLLALERKLSRNHAALAMMSERIQQVRRQLQHFAVTDEQVIANIADIYSDIISNLGPKIQISGNPHILQQKQVQNKIRALLLAAMRSAVLWRQLGGKRRQLVFSRKAIVDTANNSLTLY
ncbi:MULTISPECIES: high frequency lysogenization protein HflD [Shewanella]|uniref:High frequency lysogenization protein HflD homolog n=1 Tax=Shewanella fodinae TaxID=552357 RepID=A0A4R2FAX6_9GAMM|nr:high frequency lysogenization protein HflD [Shewanella fodinae]MBO1271400.1 high frequency lysogenization protein HflD [Shewanella sp. 4t3-1-2LB]MDN5369696.1 high frequency lysogenization protein [Shewanella sp.]TCN83637.1 high frequency lysogenization protein [Shewanella fodinae]GGY90411.1 high frequency lysogenization protein HflD [Shewanella fodinae]